MLKREPERGPGGRADPIGVALRVATRALSPAGARARLSVLIFHRVPGTRDELLPGEPDGPTFDRLLGWVGRQFEVLPLGLALDRLYSGTLPAGAAAITFDDGYRDNFEVALPILQRHRMNATFFVATGYLGRCAMFNDCVIEAVRHADTHVDAESIGLGRVPTTSREQKLAAIEALLPRVKRLPLPERDRFVRALGPRHPPEALADLMMTPAQVRALADAGMTVGAHTRNHPVLAAVDDAVARAEIVAGADDVAQILGERPRLFAYPNGRPESDFQQRHATMAHEAGFEFALTTASGAATASHDRYRIPRFTPWDRARTRFGARLVANLRRT